MLKCVFSLQNVCLDHLNLRLANYELDTEAFAAFRSRQLQAPKALICDPIRSQFEDKDEEEQEKNASLFLEDLRLVSGVYGCYLIVNGVMVIVSILLALLGLQQAGVVAVPTKAHA